MYSFDIRSIHVAGQLNSLAQDKRYALRTLVNCSEADFIHGELDWKALDWMGKDTNS